MIIRKTTLRDLELFTPSPEDIAEAKAYGIEPKLSLNDSMHTVSLYGLPVAIGGNAGDQVWFVTSANAWRLRTKGKREFRKCIIEYRNKMLEQYPVIWNYVWVGNTHHIRFLKTIGAVFHNEFTGADGQFQLFTIGG